MSDLAKQRVYQRQWYIDNKEKRRAQIMARKKFYLEEFRKLKDRPCSDCGERFPYYVMDFDHLKAKKYNISTLVGRGASKRLREELKKCELVCSNCHRIRTFNRTQALVA